MSRRWGTLGGVVLLGLACAGCVPPSVLGDLKGLDAETLIASPPVIFGTRMMRDRSGGHGGDPAHVLRRAHRVRGLLRQAGGTDQDGSAKRASQGFIVWSFASFLLIGTVGWTGDVQDGTWMRQPWYSVDYTFRALGRGLGQLITPRDANPYREWIDQVIYTNEAVLNLRRLVSLGREPDELEKMASAAAVLEWHSSATGATLNWINSTGIIFMKILLQVSHAWLLAFMTQLFPLAAVCMVLPFTRRMFWAYCRAYLAVCLWPVVFGALELVNQGIPFAWFFKGVKEAGMTSDVTTAVSAVAQGTVMMFVCNVVFFFAYLGVPVATVLLVNASGKPFRNR